MFILIEASMSQIIIYFELVTLLSPLEILNITIKNARPKVVPKKHLLTKTYFEYIFALLQYNDSKKGAS